jgi:hypothetical protein
MIPEDATNGLSLSTFCDSKTGEPEFDYESLLKQAGISPS